YAVTALIRDGSELTVRANVDRKAGALSAEVTVTGKLKSELAATIAAVGKGQTQLAGIWQADAAVNVLLHAALPASVRESLAPVIDEGIRKAVEKETKSDERAAASTVLRAIAPTLKAGELDMAVSLRGPSANKRYTALAALKVKQGEELDKALRSLAKEAP